MQNSKSTPCFENGYTKSVPAAAPGAEASRVPPPAPGGQAELTRDPGWLLIEEGFTLAREHEVESLFGIANGYAGNRGSLAEGSPLSKPATFVAGVFEKEDSPSSVPGFFVLPDWTCVRAWVEGQPLSMQEGEILRHRRILDLRRGVLWREWRHKDPNGRITRILAHRLASLADRHMLVHSVIFSPENYTGKVLLETSIELAPNAAASPPSEEYKARRSGIRHNVLPLALVSPGTGITIAFGAASQLVSPIDNSCRREIEMDDRRVVERFHLDAQIGTEYRLDRLVSIYTSRDLPEPLEQVVTHVNQFFPAGVGPEISRHAEAWNARWECSDVELQGDDAFQRALRFAAYHLISAANPEDERVSIGARALTGESYKGHVFWDTEIYMVPFYIFTDPRAARALLLYRYETLPAARAKARAFGYHGAMYPWESADTGEEVTPSFVLGPDGQVIRVRNGEMEIHITADIAYAVWQYWRATGDDEFFQRAGAEIVLESARFWASRGRMEEDGRYHIRHVIGPDEYHEDVDDSAYTNLMAAWSLRRGLETAQLLEQQWPERWKELSDRLQLNAAELSLWPRLADALYTGFDAKTRLYEQFHGYFQRQEIDLRAYEPRSAAMDVILGHDRIQQTNVVKQADVVMANWLLWEQFPSDVIETNFRYYEPRTGHGSSLSPSMHALVAARLGALSTADKYLRQAAEIDLGNNMGNAAGGVHAAAIGGLWQAVVFGFAGVRMDDAGFSLDPHLLPHWKRVSFPLQFRGNQLRFALEADRIEIRIQQSRKPVRIALTGGPETLAAGDRKYTIERNGPQWGAWREVPG